MSVEIKMPQLGQTSDEVKIIRWLVSEGQQIKAGETLCEIETDKVNMEMESTYSGTVLRLVAKPEETVTTGQVVAIIKPEIELAGTKREELEQVAELLIPYSQEAVARYLAKSKREIPHFYLKTVIDADNILKIRQSGKNSGNKTSVSAIIIYALAKCLEKMPKLNSYFKENKIFNYNKINIGFAAATEEELFVPVIKEANKKSIIQINNEIKELSAKAKNKSFKPGDISGGTFTFTNLGMYAIDEFYPIINQKQGAIIAAGRLRKVTIIDEKSNIVAKDVLTITGSFDHRFINGSVAAEFITLFKKMLERQTLAKE